MLSIAVTDSADSSAPITLGGELYDFRFNFNSLDEVYRLDIYHQQKLVIGSLDLKLGALITDKHNLPDFDHGELFLAQVKSNAVSPTRDNVGVGKSYELIYVTNDELGR